MNRNLKKKAAEVEKLLEPLEYEYRKIKRDENGRRVEIKEMRILRRSKESVRKLVGLSHAQLREAGF